MVGIYLHIPFCRQKCHYCNFFSVATLRQKGDLLDALIREAEERRDYLGDEEVHSVYFGGGTPSLLTADEINRILAHLSKFFNISIDSEITLEANPDDISTAFLHELGHTPVNRISIGIQSFFEDDLRYLNRLHSARQGIDAIQNSLHAGYTNLSIDLIYGIPMLSKEKWLQNLDTFFSFHIPHLSAYALTVEPKTALYQLILKKKAAPVDEEQSIDHFKTLLDLAKQNNYIHYEISNFSLEGFHSRHNSLYWLGGNYLGLGPSAHSYNGYSRQWNVSNIGSYIDQSSFKDSKAEKELLSVDQKFNEYVMTSLRTSWGCDLEHIRNVFGNDYSDQFLKSAEKYVNENKLVRKGDIFFLTDEGKLFADGIASDLFANEK